MAKIPKESGPLEVGKQKKIIDEVTTGPGETHYKLSIDSDALLLAVYVRSVTSGDILVSATTFGDTIAENIPIITFPLVSAPTANLILRKSTLSLQKTEIVVTYTGIVDYFIVARAISSADLTVSISPPITATSFSTTVNPVAGVIIAASANDRAGLVLRNWSTSGIIYIGFSPGEATVADGYPIGPTEQMGIDLDAGQAIYGISSGPVIDLRIMSAGN